MGIGELRSTSKILDQLLTQQTHTKEGLTTVRSIPKSV